MNLSLIFLFDIFILNLSKQNKTKIKVIRKNIVIEIDWYKDLLKIESNSSYFFCATKLENLGIFVDIQDADIDWIPFNAAKVIPIWPATIGPLVANKIGLNNWNIK